MRESARCVLAGFRNGGHVSGNPQASLEFEARWKYARLWETFLPLIVDAVERLTLKESAYRCDVSPGRLENALKGRDRHVLRAEWLMTLIAEAPSDDMLVFLARLRGLEVVPAKKMTPEEKLAAYERELPKLLGPEAIAKLKELTGAK